jgi:hypothetical protein
MRHWESCSPKPCSYGGVINNSDNVAGLNCMAVREYGCGQTFSFSIKWRGLARGLVPRRLGGEGKTANAMCSVNP